MLHATQVHAKINAMILLRARLLLLAVWSYAEKGSCGGFSANSLYFLLNLSVTCSSASRPPTMSLITYNATPHKPSPAYQSLSLSSILVFYNLRMSSRGNALTHTS